MRPGDEVAGRYRLDELQGQGPMSEVWRAHDRTLDRTVALKILSPSADLARFRRESQALAGLGHENVMRVYDYGEDEAGPFMALEWLPGGTLEDRLTGKPLAAGEIRRVAVGMAAGLAHLHSRGLVHRDLKPANVLFDEEGRPKLGDFGLARHVAGSGTLTEAGTVLGTAAYISPEQAAGEPAGAASDVYSFGVILFRLLTGSLPFVAEDALALADMHRHAPQPPVEALQPEAPPALAALTAAALRKDPAQRPADGEALLLALGQGPSASGAGAPDTEVTRILSPPVAEPAARRPGSRTAAVALALVLLAVGGGALAWAVTRPDTPAPAGAVTTGAASGAKRTGTADTTQALPPTTQSHEHTRHHPKRKRPKPSTTTGHTTTAPATTLPATTLPTTTLPTTTLPTTTLPATTLPTTTLPTTSLGATAITTAATGTT
ncbi:MAG TPA: serine/threonine-protein kinase [Gaiellaceae bacterium]|nr:serine/threonine-protein kinase [Gaiellaceae bacterium]